MVSQFNKHKPLCKHNTITDISQVILLTKSWMRLTENTEGRVGDSSCVLFFIFSFSDDLETRASEPSTTRLPLTVAKLPQILLNTGWRPDCRYISYTHLFNIPLKVVAQQNNNMQTFNERSKINQYQINLLHVLIKNKLQHKTDEQKIPKTIESIKYAKIYTLRCNTGGYCWLFLLYFVKLPVGSALCIVRTN